MLVEYVGLMSKIQKEKPHTKQLTALRGQPLRVKVSPRNRSSPEYSSK